MKFESRRSKVNTGDLRTPVVFYIYKPSEGPMPGEKEISVAYECYARVDEVFKRDFEQAKANNTMNDVTLTIRDPLEEFYPENKHYLSINSRGYIGKRFNIKKVQPDTKNFGFLTVIASVIT